MSYLRRFAYMGLGALLVLALVIGGVAAFAQDDGEAAQLAVQDDDGDPQGDGDTLQDDEAEAEAEEGDGLRVPGLRGDRLDRSGNDELLAEALDITVAEVEAAEDAAYAAALEQAVAEGLITEGQAERLQGRGFGRDLFRALELGKDELLADALGISVAELEAAEAEVRAARLAVMVEAGTLTQEEADLIAAREAVQGYLDQDALAETMQNAYEAAVAGALADGVITQAQADRFLESISTFDFHFDGLGRGFASGGRGGHHGGRHHGPGTFFAPDGDTGAPTVDAEVDA